MSQVHRAIHMTRCQAQSPIHRTYLNHNSATKLLVTGAMKAADVLDATLTLFNVQAVNTPVFLRNLFHVDFVRLSGENSTLEV